MTPAHQLGPRSTWARLDVAKCCTWRFESIDRPPLNLPQEKAVHSRECQKHMRIYESYGSSRFSLKWNPTTFVSQDLDILNKSNIFQGDAWTFLSQLQSPQLAFPKSSCKKSISPSKKSVIISILPQLCHVDPCAVTLAWCLSQWCLMFGGTIGVYRHGVL